MGFFTKRERIFEEKGAKEKWKVCKTALKEAGMDISSGSYPSEAPICGCGSKLDIRDFGPKGKIDRDIYYIEVAIPQVEEAKSLLKVLL